MPKSTTNSNNNDESDNDFSSVNENSNLSEINPMILSNQSNLRTSSNIPIPSTFNQNSSSSTASFTTNNNLNINSSININNLNNSSNSSNKKFRHQNFSKNIYIGTKNAEKWDNLRNLFQFKNDVEFVSFLLKAAEKEAKTNKNGIKLPIFEKNSTDNSEDYDKEQSSSSLYLHKKQKKMELQQPVSPPPQQLHEPQQQQQQPQPQPQQQQQQPQIPPQQNQQQQHQLQQQQLNVQKKIKRVQFQDNVNIINDDNLSQQHELNLSKSAGATNDNNAQDHSISSTIDGSVSSDESNNTTEILDCRIEEKIKNELVEKQKLIESGRNSTNMSGRYDEAPTPPPNITSSLIDKEHDESDDNDDDEESDMLRPQLIHKRRFYDIRKAPTILDVKMNDGMPGSNQDKSVFDFKDDDDDDDDDCEEGRLEINSEFMIRDRKNKKPYKSKVCLACNTKHGKEICPIRNPIGSIPNPIDYSEWVKDHPEPPPPPPLPIDNTVDDKLFMDESMKSENEGDDDQDDGEDPDDLNDDELEDKQPPVMQEDSDEITFSEISLPKEFDLLPSTIDPMIKKSVFTKILIPKYTQIGPLIGELVREVDIPDDCNMAYIFEIHDSILSKSIYYNMENKNKSNWIRYLQPARARDQRNLTMIKVEDKIYFVSCMDINVGCELLYWSDEVNSAWGKKKIEKTNCGGCNLKFEHPIHYRTHCSVFHDPGFSLTIRKYHCKICGMAVLGKENIMKHAEKLHDGKGAYQCQFCKKFFLRLNYLEMHRTYGCSANPQRARPLCDFCGRKFCQPQKLKVHIKRMHSDMAEVLRDFQCKLCSKLLGSRAALQRHSKEVHSRNSTVVSCPRCQKLFQNRSNLKIHMLTHSGVRPFKCTENECTAAFTTKQCLQFHYKKVHGYTQEQMPKIERSVAYTFDAYSGGMKHEDLEAMTRRQRKNLGESLNKVTKSMPKREKEMILKDKNFLSSITDLCKNESNLNLLSSKISSILNCNLKEMNKKLMSQNEMGDTEDNCADFDGSSAYSEHANTNDLESKLMSSKGISLLHHKRNEENQENLLNHPNIPGSDTNTQDMDGNDDDDDDSDRNSFKMGTKRMMDSQQLALPSNARLKDFLMQTNPNLVMSKGSKKWISETSNHMSEMEEPDANLMAVANRDFLAKLINSKFQKNHNHNRSVDNEDDDDNSTILDVVDSNIQHQQQQQQHQQQQHQESGQFNPQFANANNNDNDLMDMQSQYTNNVSNNSFNPHFNPLGGFYNSNSTINRTMASSIPTSASLLVEAALNSVSNMIGTGDMESNENQQININNNDTHQNELPDDMSNNQFNSAHNMMDAVDDNMKIMKSQDFPLHLPPMSQFANNNSNNMMNESNEIEVDAVPTPKSQEKLCSYASASNADKEINSFSNQQNDSCSPAREMTPDQHSNYNSNFNNPRAQIQNSPSQIPSRQMYTEHDLISPASTPSLPRYDFGGENYRRREKSLQPGSSGIENYNKNMHHHQQQQQQHMTQLSSDEENSIVIAENLSVNHQTNHVGNDKIKLNSQIDLLYAQNNSKYDTTANTPNQLHRESLNDLRMKYNEQGIDIQEFRNSVVSDNVGVGASGGSGPSDYQGLDMTSRGSLGYHPHNFQISSSSTSNLSFNRYQHHIYDILTDREQQNQQQTHQQQSQPQQQSQQDHHSFQSMQQQQQQIQHLLQDHISQDQDTDQIPSGVDLSRTSNYIVPPSPPAPHLPYAVHTPSEMLRMVSLDLSSGGSGAAASMVGTNNSHHVRHHSSFLPHGPNRELSDHHRFLSTADQRLLVDPTAHLLIEQNNRLLSSENNRILDQTRLLSETSTNRHVVSPRGFGAYHHPHSHPHHSHHQVSSSNYHHHHTTVKQSLGSPTNQHSSANYHPFSASYY